MKKKVAAILVLVMVASLSVAGCTVGLPSTSSSSPTPIPTKTPSTLTQVISADPNLTTFASLLKKANLTDVLDGPETFTVFAPDNAAFSKVDASTLASWQNNTTELKSVLWYHIIPKKIPSNELTGIGTLMTVNGQILPYYVTGTTIRVDNATVTQGDINAVILVAVVGGALHIPIGGNTTATSASSSSQALYAHSIVCVGDSITKGLADPDNWPTLLKARLGGDWQVVNQGLGGNKTADMLVRIDQALALNPHFVIIMGGTNDLANGDVPLATIQANIREMCSQVESHGAVPVLCTVPPDNYSLEQRDILNGWIAEYANSKGYGLIDFYAVIDNPANPGHSNPLLVMSDGLHPNAEGYSAMGNAIDLGIFTGN